MAYLATTVKDYLAIDPDTIIGKLTISDNVSGFTQLSQLQVGAWYESDQVLRDIFRSIVDGLPNCGVVLEYRLPRRDKRIDCVLLIGGVVVVIEFKAGSKSISAKDMGQVLDYAVDLGNYHHATRQLEIQPILCATEYQGEMVEHEHPYSDRVHKIITVGSEGLADVVRGIAASSTGRSIDSKAWVESKYAPVPGILDAVNLLFAEGDQSEIEQCLAQNSVIDRAIDEIKRATVESVKLGQKTVLIVTGVPGAGKTLVGLKVVHSFSTKSDYGVYLSGNGPLLKVMKESLARGYAKAQNLTLAPARKMAETLLHSVHSFIDHHKRSESPPGETLFVFDEAQRTWDAEKIARMSGRQRAFAGAADTPTEFDELSEPEILLRVLDRKEGGCVIVALCGTGQEIHDGEAGIEGWIAAVQSNPHWTLVGPEAEIEKIEPEVARGLTVVRNDNLHLSVPLRSHRADNHSRWVDAVVLGNAAEASKLIDQDAFPIRVVRSVDAARNYINTTIRGERRAGLLASSGAKRLRPYGVEVSSDFRKGIDFAYWFTGEAGDFRSSHGLEVAATEFECQGLELDWTVLVWCWDLLLSENSVITQVCSGAKWKKLANERKRSYLINKYRVLLTRARLGMVIVVPHGSPFDASRPEPAMDSVFEYLKQCGCTELP